MIRRRLGPLLLGWLLGLLTVFLLPSISTERRSVVVLTVGSGPREIAALTAMGWVVTRTDTIGSNAVVQFERPRYLALLEAVGAAQSPLQPSPKPTTAPAAPPALPKPTEAPKPAAPAASPQAP